MVQALPTFPLSVRIISQQFLTVFVVKNFKAVTVLMGEKVPGDNIGMFQNDIYVLLVKLRVKPLLSGGSLKGSWWHVAYNENLKREKQFDSMFGSILLMYLLKCSYVTGIFYADFWSKLSYRI